MSEPRMQSPLHHLDLASRAAPADASKGVWANEIPLQGYISLRGSTQEAAFVAGASQALGCALPVAPCTFAATPTLKVLWLAPDEWMIVCPRERLPALLRDLEQALAGVRSQVADNSGGHTQILLKGKNASDVLSHTSVYDLAALAEGRIVGTTFGKSSLYLHREQADFILFLRRSFADYIWRYLERSATPYGFGVAALEAAGGARRDAA